MQQLSPLKYLYLFSSLSNTAHSLSPEFVLLIGTKHKVVAHGNKVSMGYDM